MHQHGGIIYPREYNDLQFLVTFLHSLLARGKSIYLYRQVYLYMVSIHLYMWVMEGLYRYVMDCALGCLGVRPPVQGRRCDHDGAC